MTQKKIHYRLAPTLFILAILAVPILEVGCTVFIAHKLGALNTFLLFVGTTTFGVLTNLYEWRRDITPWSRRLKKMDRNDPEYKIQDARNDLRMLILVVGFILLLIPGFVTDAIAYFLLVPFKNDAMLDKFVDWTEDKVTKIKHNAVKRKARKRKATRAA